MFNKHINVNFRYKLNLFVFIVTNKNYNEYQWQIIKCFDKQVMLIPQDEK